MLGINAKTFCSKVGIAYSNDVLRSLRDNNQVKFINIGRKFIYLEGEAEKVKKKIINGEISIKTDNKRYYITVNE